MICSSILLHTVLEAFGAGGKFGLQDYKYMLPLCTMFKYEYARRDKETQVTYFVVCRERKQ